MLGPAQALKMRVASLRNESLVRVFSCCFCLVACTTRSHESQRDTPRTMFFVGPRAQILEVGRADCALLHLLILLTTSKLDLCWLSLQWLRASKSCLPVLKSGVCITTTFFPCPPSPDTCLAETGHKLESFESCEHLPKILRKSCKKSPKKWVPISRI